MSTILSITAIIISFATLLATLYTSHANNQWQLFSEYTSRYASIITDIPTEVLEGKDYDIFDKKPIRKYFDLCSEEFYLYQHKMIPSKVWKYWKEGMIITMRNKWFYETWRDCSVQKDYNKEFRHFMNRIVEISLENKDKHSN